MIWLDPCAHVLNTLGWELIKHVGTVGHNIYLKYSKYEFYAKNKTFIRCFRKLWHLLTNIVFVDRSYNHCLFICVNHPVILKIKITLLVIKHNKLIHIILVKSSPALATKNWRNGKISIKGYIMIMQIYCVYHYWLHTNTNDAMTWWIIKYILWWCYDITYIIFDFS